MTCGEYRWGRESTKKKTAERQEAENGRGRWMVLVDKIKEIKNDKVKGTVKGGEGMKREARRTEKARQKRNRDAWRIKMPCCCLLFCASA